MARSAAPALAVLLMAFFLVAAPFVAESAVTCGSVVTFIRPCIDYVRNVGGLPPACCGGVRQLNAAAKTTPDRQQACACIKSVAAGIKGLNDARLAGVAGMCGVKLPYTISKSMNCATVH